ncbi:hypothetical protein DFQ26_004601, partial [Actinomortierella ambigua]
MAEGVLWLFDERYSRRDDPLAIETFYGLDGISNCARELALHPVLRQYPAQVEDGATLQGDRYDAVGAGREHNEDTQALEATLVEEVAQEAV